MGLATPPKAEADAKRQKRPAGEAKITKKIKDRSPYLGAENTKLRIKQTDPVSLILVTCVAHHHRNPDYYVERIR